jgi:iron(III) transport system ATP-binding protein
VGRLELATGAEGDAAGAAITLAIRPEDVRVPAKLGDANALAARVASVTFLGSFFRVEFTGGDLGDARVRADVPVDAARDLCLDEGQTLWLSLPAACLRVYPSAPEGAPDPRTGA